jgi:hypothetical protein
VSNDETNHQPPKGRSPSFPGVALETAVQRARTVYDKLRQHQVPLKSFTDAWGFKTPTSGPASVTFAALKKYGLVEDEGSGDARVGQLTDLAVDIIMKPEPLSAIQQAALTPPINREMWDRFKADIPPEDALRYEFVVKRGFTENGFRDFIRVYRDTVAYARLGETDGDVGTPDERSARAADSRTEDVPARQAVPVPPATDVSTYTVPVALGVNVTVSGPFPLTTKAWEQFMTVLVAMRPALAGDNARGAQETSVA